MVRSGVRQRHVVALLALLAGGYLLLPQRTASIVFAVSGVIPVVVMCVGIRRHRPVDALPWWLLTAGVALLVTGDAAYTVQDMGEATEPFPSVADGIYLLAYPLLCVAVVLLLRRARVSDSAAWLDAAIWTGGAVVLAWVPLLAPYAHDPSLSGLQRAVALAFPVMDLVLLLLVLHVGRGAGVGGVHLLVALAMGSMMLSDTVYAVRSLAGTYHSGEPTDLGWLLCYGLLARATMHPDLARLVPPTHSRLTPSRRLLCLLAPTLTAPAVLGLLLERRQLQGDVQGGTLVAVATAVLFVLAGLRGRLLLRELHHRESALHEVLDERELLTDELRRRATCCGLTGLANRAGFLEQVGAALTLPDPLVLGLLDLDDFKSVNDTLGHDAGDRLLVEVAMRLRSALGPLDLVGRLGGDEFAVLLRGDAPATADRIVEALGRPLLVEGQELAVRGSLGLVERTDNSALGDLMRRADVAMYDAKSQGGDRWASYRPEMSASLLRRLDLRSQLVTALERSEIVPWFQAIVDLETGRPIGFEALARWCRPGRTVVPPGDWLELAEQTGLIVAIDQLVLRQAVAELAGWRVLQGTGTELTLGVNVSGRTLREPHAAQELLAVLQAHDVPPSALMLEVTHSELREDDDLGTQLQVLRAAGVQVALDDFGTGWSSLSHLAQQPVDVLKLDGSFTRGLGVSASREAVARAVLQLGVSLGLTVIAEGVEDEGQAAWLRESGARYGQGFLYGPVEPATRTRERIARLALLPSVGAVG